MNSHSHTPAGEPWSAFSEGWSRLGLPLRPCPEDLQRLHQARSESLPAGIPQRRIAIFSLGVTPEIAQFPWTGDIHVTAIDSSQEMIQRVWPGHSSNRKAVLGNWLEMPFANASFDLILTDTGLALVVGEERLRAAAAQLRRVLISPMVFGFAG